MTNRSTFSATLPAVASRLDAARRELATRAGLAEVVRATPSRPQWAACSRRRRWPATA